jgi:phthalate 4,5-dioxygenase
VQDSQGPIADRTREHLGPTDLGIMHFRKLVMESARALQQGETPAHLKHQDRYAVRSGACVTNKAKDLPEVMVERFGDKSGYVGRPSRNAAAE